MKHIHIHKENHNFFDKTVQVLLPVVAVLSWLLTSIKHPEYGLIVAFIAQSLWLYVTYYGWKKANQVGGFITTVFEIAIITFGIFNYWFFTK
jgi:Flp pilus assembly pilin Flp